MNGSCFVDTNIFVYFRDSSEPEKQQITADWLNVIWNKQIGRLSYQVLNEYYVSVTKKLKPGMDCESARLDVKNLMAWNPVVVDRSIIENSWIIQDRYAFSWWDSLIIGTALKANCSILLTEDLQHQQRIEGITVINPFKIQIERVIQ
jgi:predicted nucleic acid-binding protein